MASISSICSAQSNQSTKYRRIARKSSIDESLFGSKGSTSLYHHRGSKKANKANENSTTISFDKIQQMKYLLASSNNSLSISSKHTSNNGETSNNDEEFLTRSRTPANARKEYMRQLELKEIEEQNQIVSQFDEEKHDRIRKMAHEKLVEDHDIVKLLKTCNERATTFNIRDQQLKDKLERSKKDQDYEQCMVLAMEIDCLKEIEAREAEEEKKLRKMIEGRKIIEDQIEQRKDAKLLLEATRDQENREILKKINLYQIQDEQKAQEKRDGTFKARLEIIKANEEHVTSQHERKLIEKREDEMMVARQIEQDKKVLEREKKHADAQRKKEAIHKKLLTEQKRAVDRRSEMDELRERRAVEEAERKFRQKQLVEAQKRVDEVKALDAARVQQQQERYQKQKLMMEQKREEYENAIKHSRAMAERERAEAEYVRQKNIELINNLKEQIDQNSKRQLALEKEKIHEGLVMKQQLADERAKLEAVRAKMLNDMKARGISDKYFGEIVSIDIDRLLMK